MAVVEMNKISLIGLETDKERVLENLMKIGMVEVKDLSENLSSDEWKDLAQNDGDNESIQELEAKIEKSLPSLSIWRGMIPKKRTILFKSGSSINDHSLVLKNQDKLLSVIDGLLMQPSHGRLKI